MKWFTRHRVLTAVVVLVASYLLAMIPVGVNLYSAYKNAKSIHHQFNPNKYQNLVNEIDTFNKELRSPLLLPLHLLSVDIKPYEILFDRVKPILPVAPAIGGFEGSRNYLIIFQNPAESRGTGGIVGAFAVAHVDKGSISFTKIGSNSQLQSLQELPVSMPSDYLSIYGNDPAIWQNANESPDFPSGANIMLALWQKQFNQTLDGVITLDPIVLSQILEVTGPVEAYNHRITAQNVVEETLSNAYIEYAQNNVQRKDFLVQIISAVANKLKSPKISKLQIAKTLAPSFQDNRILLYSSHANEENLIKQATVSGSLSLTNGNDYRLVLINTAGNKMDYYVKRKLQLSRTACNSHTVVATFTLSNSASSQLALPPYVKGRLDLNLPNGKSNSTSVAALLYGPPNSKVTQVRSGGLKSSIYSEMGRPLMLTRVELPADKSVSLSATFVGGVGKVMSYDQPLVTPQQDAIVDRCTS